MSRRFLFTFFFLVFSFLFFSIPKNTHAQTCNGTATTTYTAYNCGGDSINGYHCDPVQRNLSVPCSWQGGNCQVTFNEYNYACTTTPTGCIFDAAFPVTQVGCYVTGGGSTPTPPPGICYRCHPGANFCESYIPGGACTTDCNGCPGSTPPPSDPCPNDSCSGSCCNYACGHACIVTADCQPTGAGGAPTYCLPHSYPSAGGPLGTCVNSLCPNDTQPGTVCACNGGIACGAPCAGGCVNGSVCTFTDPTCSGGAGTTYCVGVASPLPLGPNTNYSTYNSNYQGLLCSPGAWHLHGISPSQDTGFTQQQIQSTCKTNPWYQAVGGDIISGGNLQSTIPTTTCVMPTCNPHLILDSVAGLPGNAVFNGITNLTTTTFSSKGWNANTSYLGKTYNYNYFLNHIPSTATLNPLPSVAGNTEISTTGVLSNGYYWYKTDSDLTISSDVTIPGDRKVIIFVPGNLTINAKINIQTKGRGFFIVIVQGNILVSGSLNNGVNPALEGIYITNGIFDTGSGATRLYVRGTVVTYTSFTLARDLVEGNSTSPSHTFEYAPELVYLFPPTLVPIRTVFNEVAP